MAFDEFEEENEIAGDEWDEFRDDDGEPINLASLAKLDLSRLPHDVAVSVMDDYFPETIITRDAESLVCEISEHLYTKYWEHKFSAYAFAEAMERAVKRLTPEGHPFAHPFLDAEDVHIFVRWQLLLPLITASEVLASSIKGAFDLVWQRADGILENSDCVLILGKNTGEALDRLKRIESKLQDLGYYTYIIKEQPDKAGESVVQKVMRFALSSRFVLIENSEASGHLYEMPHVAKAAECVTVVLQEEGRGATWMFEDAYAKHKHWHKVEYTDDALETAVEEAVTWAEKFVSEFSDRQIGTLPWLKVVHRSISTELNHVAIGGCSSSDELFHPGCKVVIPVIGIPFICLVEVAKVKALPSIFCPNANAV